MSHNSSESDEIAAIAPKRLRQTKISFFSKTSTQVSVAPSSTATVVHESTLSGIAETQENDGCSGAVPVESVNGFVVTVTGVNVEAIGNVPERPVEATAEAAMELQGTVQVDKTVRNLAINLPPAPNQPTRIVFPTKHFGTETFTRGFKSDWFSKWQWLHYDNEADAVLCFTCAKAEEMHLLLDVGNKDDCFVRGGLLTGEKRMRDSGSMNCLVPTEWRQQN
jgi:hypothetical protein